MKGRVSINLDELVHHTNSPFTTQVTFCPLPPKFQMPQVEIYDESKDPQSPRAIQNSHALARCAQQDNV